jgi:hypothetical protein
MLIEYIFLTSFFLVLGLAAYIRIRHPFWSLQPVFHTYDFWRYWVMQPYVIESSLGRHPNKCLKLDLVQTKEFLDASDEERAAVLDLIQCKYMSSEQMTYMILNKDLHIQCTHTISAPGLVSLLKGGGGGGVDGCMISYPVRFCHRGHPMQTLFYWEYIVVRQELDARILIQTHEYNQRRKHPDIPASLIRKDVNLSEGIVPVVQFQVSKFELTKSVGKPPLAPACTVTRIRTETMHVIMDFLYDMTTRGGGMNLYVFPEMPGLQARIESNQWFVYTMQMRDELLAVYAFKDSKIMYEGTSETATSEIELAASQMLRETDDKALFAGFLHALHDLMSTRPELGFITIPHMSHNQKIVETWKWKYGPCSTHAAAFYLYNFVCPVPETAWIML